MLTNCLRSEFRNEIKFYSIHPGRLITELSQTDADLTVEIAAERIVAAWKHGDLEDDTGIIEIGSKGYNW
jgi:hypothetical protein